MLTQNCTNLRNHIIIKLYCLKYELTIFKLFFPTLDFRGIIITHYYFRNFLESQQPLMYSQYVPTTKVQESQTFFFGILLKKSKKCFTDFVIVIRKSCQKNTLITSPNGFAGIRNDL